jgi:Cys-tRNA(Pro)/Cys-tRNA(Cys) deacylase
VDDRSGEKRVTDAIEELGIAATIVRTAPASNAEESAHLQGIQLSQLLKTIVVRKDDGEHVFVLVPGDRAIDWRKLRTHLGVSRASLPGRADAERITGYPVGAITPFGALSRLPVVVDAAAVAEETVALGGGERGVNVHISPSELKERLGAVAADVTSVRSSS